MVGGGAAPANRANWFRPDGDGIWAEGDTRLPFLLKSDNGTERLARLADKLPGYAGLAVAAGHHNWVLFAFPTPRREREARTVLTHPDVPSPPPPDAGPDGAVWLPTTVGAAWGTDRYLGATRPAS